MIYVFQQDVRVQASNLIYHIPFLVNVGDRLVKTFFYYVATLF